MKIFYKWTFRSYIVHSRLPYQYLVPAPTIITTTCAYCSEEKGVHQIHLKCRPFTAPYLLFWLCTELFQFHNGEVTLCADSALSSGLLNKRWGKKTLHYLSSSFLFRLRHDKWLVSVPPENNATAFTVCPCLLSLLLPVFSILLLLFFFFNLLSQTLSPSTHSHTYRPPILILSLSSVWNSFLSLVPPLSLCLHHFAPSSTPHRIEREANIILAEEQVRVKRRPRPSLSGIKGKALREAGDKDGACLKF